MSAPSLRRHLLQRPPVVYGLLPVSELSVHHRRLEGEAYLTGGYAIRRALEGGNAPFARLDTLAAIWMPGRLKGITVAARNGIPFLAATQVLDIRPTPRKWLAAAHTDDLTNRFVQPGWILMTCSGAVGESIISFAPHIGSIISHDLLRIQVKQEHMLGYVYAFLRTRYAREMLQSSQYGSIIKHLESEHVSGVPVPLAGEAMRRAVGARIGAAFEARERAFKATLEAEALYAASLNAAPVEPAPERGYSVSATELFSGRRRLDGYYYNPVAEAALKAVAGSRRPQEQLRRLVQRVFSVPRFKHVYTETGIPYLDSEDIFKVNPTVTKFIPREASANPTAPEKMAKYYVEKGWLLMACSGQLYGINGSVALADRLHERKILSNHILRIVPYPKPMIPMGYLQMVLGHPTLGRPLVLRYAFGTEVPELSPDDIGAFYVPRLRPTIEEEIARLVVEASALRMDADEKENEAVAEVENAVRELLNGAFSFKREDRTVTREVAKKRA